MSSEMSLVLARRSLLGAIGLAIAAPVIVRASSLMPANVLLTNQAPQLRPWPDPTFSTRSPSATWATYVPRLFFTPTYLARFRANWNDPYFNRLKNVYAASTTDFYQVMTYLATGNAANLSRCL
jgi:hypothetical protein